MIVLRTVFQITKNNNNDMFEEMELKYDLDNLDKISSHD